MPCGIFCLGIIAASWLTGRPREAGDSAHERQTSLVRREGIATDRPTARGRWSARRREAPLFRSRNRRCVAPLRSRQPSGFGSRHGLSLAELFSLPAGFAAGSLHFCFAFAYASRPFAHASFGLRLGSPASRPARLAFALPLRRLHGFYSCFFCSPRLAGFAAGLLAFAWLAFRLAYSFACSARLSACLLVCLLCSPYGLACLLSSPYGLLTRWLAWLALRLACLLACLARLTACLLVGLLGSPFGLLACLLSSPYGLLVSPACPAHLGLLACLLACFAARSPRLASLGFLCPPRPRLLSETQSPLGARRGTGGVTAALHTFTMCM